MRPRKRFAQHFLEPAWIDKVLRAIDPAREDSILEIGPGRGALTGPLVARTARVVAVEIDRDLAAALEARKLPNLTIVAADVLALDLADMVRTWVEPGAAEGLRVVGNLPYNISSPILFRLLEAASVTHHLKDATLMLQKEVADRLIAVPGTGDYGVLTLLTALHADVRLLLSLPPGAFRPAPRVRSAVVRLTFRALPTPVRNVEFLTRMVRSMFTQRRKTLLNALRAFGTETDVSPARALAAAGLDGRRRPETLQLVETVALADAFAGGRGLAVL